MERITENVPYIVFEGEMSRQERHVKRLWIALIIAVVIILISNLAWLWAWLQYDYVGESVTVDSTNGVANYIGNDGDIYNGTDYSETENAAEEERLDQGNTQT